MKATYLQTIKDLMLKTQEAYDRAGTLRDYANGPEKQFYNNYRGKVGEALGDLYKLHDQVVASDRRNMKIGSLS